MQVIKATKRFRTVVTLLSLLMSVGTITVLCVPAQDCTTGNLKFAVGCLAFVWCTIFILMLFQVIGMIATLKKFNKALFVFYFIVCGCMYVCQMMIWGGVENTCMKETPVLYWYIVTNVIMFYVIVAFGLATWGSYLCKVADAYEELSKEAVSEMMAERKHEQ